MAARDIDAVVFLGDLVFLRLYPQECFDLLTSLQLEIVEVDADSRNHFSSSQRLPKALPLCLSDPTIGLAKTMGRTVQESTENGGYQSPQAYSFTPPAVSPPTRFFWIVMKSAITGTAVSIDPAMILSHIAFLEKKSDRSPIGRV